MVDDFRIEEMSRFHQLVANPVSSQVELGVSFPIGFQIHSLDTFIRMALAELLMVLRSVSNMELSRDLIKLRDLKN